MWSQAARQRMRRTLRRIGHQPIRRGGNGKLLPIPQLVLLHGLGPGWEAEYVVTTGIPPGNGIPRHYKLDLANPQMRMAIEMDGVTHQSHRVRSADLRKLMFLVERGWSVLRLSNQLALRLYSTSMSEDILRTSLMGLWSTTAT